MRGTRSEACEEGCGGAAGLGCGGAGGASDVFKRHPRAVFARLICEVFLLLFIFEIFYLDTLEG